MDKKYRSILDSIKPSRRKEFLEDQRRLSEKYKILGTASIHGIFSDASSHVITEDDFKIQEVGANAQAVSSESGKESGRVRRGKTKQRDREIAELAKAGLSAKAIAKEVNKNYAPPISPRRVQQVLKREK
jgi:DNA-binding NarL/FixJ family response regulator